MSSRFGFKSSSTPLAGVWCCLQYRLPLNPGFLTRKRLTGLLQEWKERHLWGIKDAFKMSRSPSYAISSFCIPLLEALPGVIFKNLWRGLFTADSDPVFSEASMARLQKEGRHKNHRGRAYSGHGMLSGRQNQTNKSKRNLSVEEISKQ